MATKILTEHEIIEQIQEFLTDCDSDQLATLTGELFGGKCLVFFDPDNNTVFTEVKYEFEPDENYYGAFGDIE